MLNTIKAQRACYGPQLGYTIPISLLSLVGLSSALADVAQTTLLTLLVLHLICAGLSVINFILTLFLHSHHVALVVSIITAVLATVVFAVDVALVVSVRDNIDSLFSGGDFVVSFGNGVWMILAAMVLTWMMVIVLSAQRYYFCGVRR
jgi:hypothetical protein